LWHENLFPKTPIHTDKRIKNAAFDRRLLLFQRADVVDDDSPTMLLLVRSLLQSQNWFEINGHRWGNDS
jgi:hypothetical protein